MAGDLASVINDDLSVLIQKQCAIGEKDSKPASVLEYQPEKIDFSQLRIKRQKETNALVLKALLAGDKKSIEKYCNMEELKRIIEEDETTLDIIITECSKNKEYAKLLARHIAIKSSRQGKMDEKLQIATCAKIARLLGINIVEPDKKFEPRASRIDGHVYTKTDIKNKICEKKDCLKSFDAEISGKVNGWVFAKVCYSEGGHQDNVLHESTEFCEWVVKYGSPDSLYVVLIETNNTKILEVLTKLARPNLFIGNHYEFQNYLISKYKT